MIHTRSLAVINAMRKRGKRMEVGDWNDDDSIGYAGFESLSKRMRESVNSVSTPTERKSKTLVPRGVPNPLSAMKNFSSYKSPVHTTTPNRLEQDNSAAAVVNCRGITAPSPSTGRQTHNKKGYGRNLFKSLDHSCSVQRNHHHHTETPFVKNRSKSVAVGIGGGTGVQQPLNGNGRKHDRKGYTTDDYWNDFKTHERLSSTISSHLKPVALCQLQDAKDTATLTDSHLNHKSTLLAVATDADTKPPTKDSPRMDGGNELVVGKKMLLKRDNTSDEYKCGSSSVVDSLPSKNSTFATTTNDDDDDSIIVNKLLLRECDGHISNQPPCIYTREGIADESREDRHKSLLKGKEEKKHQQQHVYGKYNKRYKDLGSRSGIWGTSENRASLSFATSSNAGRDGIKKDDDMINENDGGLLQKKPAGECSSRRATLSKQGGEYFLNRPPLLRRSRRHHRAYITSTTEEGSSLVTPWKGDSASQPVDLADSSDESAPVAREQEEDHSDNEDDVLLPCSSSSSLTVPLPGNGLEIIVLAISFKHHVFCRDMRLVLKPWERTIILTDRERTTTSSSPPASYSRDEYTYEDDTTTTGRANTKTHTTKSTNKRKPSPKIFVKLLMDELMSFRYGYVSGDDGCILLEVKDGSESFSALSNFVTSSADDQKLTLVSEDERGDDDTMTTTTTTLPMMFADEEKRRNYFWLCLASAKSFDERILPSSFSPSLGVASPSCGGDGGVLKNGGDAEMMISVRKKTERYIQISSPSVEILPVSTEVASAKLDFIAERYFQVNLCEEEKKRKSSLISSGQQSTGLSTPGGSNTGGDDELFFIYPMDAGASDVIEILGSDHLRLREGEFLNDNLIDFYLKFTLREDPVIRERVMMNGGGTSSEVHVFTSHFFSKLSEVPLRTDKWEAVHAPVSRWSKSFNIWETQFLFIPVAEHLHWSLAVICNLNAVEQQCSTSRKNGTPSDNVITDHEVESKRRPQPCIIFMDSLRLHKPKRIAGYLRAYLTQELRSINPNALPFTDTNLPCVAPSVPTQSNGCDCGIFVIKYVDHILRTWPTITRHDVDTKLKNVINPTSFDSYSASESRKKMKSELEILAMKYKEIQTTTPSTTSKRPAVMYKKRKK